VIVRIIWHSNAGWNSSGYGVQTALFVPRIAGLGHEITISAPYTFGGSPLDWQGFTTLPCARDTAGNDVLPSHYEYFNADLVITLCDVFGLTKSMNVLREMNVVHWFPVDTDPLSEGDVTVLREGQGVPVAMSRFGERVLHAEGAEPLYVPHGVDTEVFRPGDPMLYRDTIPGVTADTFVVGLCAMNRDPYRKAFAEQMLAFARFHSRHPDSFMSLHTTPVAWNAGNPGTNLPGLAARLGISGAVGFPDAYSYDMGMITREQLAVWYNGLDVLSLCSYAEGFGLPLIEAQACGVPVITTDGSAMSELCGSGWLVSGTPFWAPGHGAWWKRPDIDDIEQAYEMAFLARENGVLPQKPAYDFAQQFDADKVFEQYWKPCLAAIQDKLQDS
jgi:glycosyltransferase involved in cell wall biosynthesis